MACFSVIRSARLAVCFAAPLGVLVSAGMAEPPPPIPEPPQRTVDLDIDSGYLGAVDGREVIFATDVVVDGAEWLRLGFGDETVLAGDPAELRAAQLRITSLTDGAVQFLNAESLGHWRNTSAYFNGDGVRVELIASPTTPDSRLVIEHVIAGEPELLPESICDGVDLRVPSNDPRSARLISPGCSAWMFDDTNNMFGSAGHCGVGGNTVVQFNVPLSNPNGSLNHPPPEDQYTVHLPSNQSQFSGVGHDWRYFGTLPNSNTGLQPYQAQGNVAYETSFAPSPSSGDEIRITGYGTTSSPVNPAWNRAQKTHAGPYTSLSGTALGYRPDTTGGNSGSPVIFEPTGHSVGVHTHGGCTSSGGQNRGTAFQHPNWQNAVNNPTGICRSGAGAVEAPLYLIGDLANNFGTLSRVTGEFGKVSQPGVRLQGLAHNPHDGVFYAATGDQELLHLDESTGEVVQTVDISGTSSSVMHGLAYDAVSRTLYGIDQGVGTFFSIDPETGDMTLIGIPGGGSVGALAYDHLSGVLYGIDESGSTSTLITIDTGNGSRTVVGSLGSSITGVRGLAFCDDNGMLYAVRQSSGVLYSVNPSTGSAAQIGNSFAVLGSGYGMACLVQDPGCPADWNGDGVVDSDDLFDFLSDWSAGNADYNGDGVTDSDDLFEFLSDWSDGC